MRISIPCGLEQIYIEVAESNLVGVRRAPLSAPLPDPAGAVRDALENPMGFPALRRALTPDD
jgi:hypothetical protein